MKPSFLPSYLQVGIVGRTGAGKSSFVASLFRIVEPSSGSIHIDFLNTLNLGLHDLRSRIAIIPQNSVLLLGNIRRNLDPFDEFSDDELWNVLGQVQLLDRLGEKGNGVGLGTKVSKIPYNGS